MNINEHDKLEALLKTKSYQELNDEDKNWISEEIGGETAYEQLREMVLSLSKEGKVKTSPRIKKELVAEFRLKHQTAWGRILSYRIPAVASALIWVPLSLGLFYLLPEKQVTAEKRIPVETTRVDTLLVQLPADTVFIQRTVRIEVPIASPKDVEEKKPEPILVKGNSLSEQKGLQRLLVSGE